LLRKYLGAKGIFTGRRKRGATPLRPSELRAAKEVVPGLRVDRHQVRKLLEEKRAGKRPKITQEMWHEERSRLERLSDGHLYAKLSDVLTGKNGVDQKMRDRLWEIRDNFLRKHSNLQELTPREQAHRRMLTSSERREIILATLKVKFPRGNGE